MIKRKIDHIDDNSNSKRVNIQTVQIKGLNDDDSNWTTEGTPLLPIIKRKSVDTNDCSNKKLKVKATNNGNDDGVQSGIIYVIKRGNGFTIRYTVMVDNDVTVSQFLNLLKQSLSMGNYDMDIYKTDVMLPPDGLIFRDYIDFGSTLVFCN